MDLFREKLEVGRSLRIAFDDFDGKKIEWKRQIFRNYYDNLTPKIGQIFAKAAKVSRKFAKAQLSRSWIGKIIVDSWSTPKE